MADESKAPVPLPPCSTSADALSHQLLDILLHQNAALEQEVNRLVQQVDELSQGVQKKGYLFKWREREIYYASRWGLRYFVLQRDQLSYYGDEHERRPRRTISLHNCVVRDEGEKKAGQYHVFALYLQDASTHEPLLLLRLSSVSSAEATQWMDMLQRACDLHQPPTPLDAAETDSSAPASPMVKDGVDDDSWGQHQGDLPDQPLLPPTMLQRVRSSSLVLRKSQSRQLLQRKPRFTVSGTRLHSAVDLKSLPPPEKASRSNQFPAYKPMHLSAAPSPLSNETRPGEYNFRGFFNLGVIILFLSHCDLIVNNMSRYGFKLQLAALILHPTKTDFSSAVVSAHLPHFAGATLVWLIATLLCWAAEKLYARQRLSERVILVINYVIGSLNIALPCYFVWTSPAHPSLNLLYLFQSVVIWMKLISYAHANKDLRVASRKKLERESSSGYSSEDVDNNSKPENYVRSLSEVKDIQPPYLQYPHNLSLINLGYFLVAPTLCYQLNYPRTSAVRWNKVAFLLFRLVFVGIAIVFSVEQYIHPTLETAIQPMLQGDVMLIAERVLKLSIPNTYVWLLGFYFYFHLWLNLLAELTRFGDRLFYKDWWNAKTVDRYWRTWNLPVHHWATRHLYYPLLRAGCGKVVATLVVFGFSALMHELVISLPFHHLSFHAFLGMMAQVPLIFVAKYLDRRFDNAFLGNALFWCSFCVVGQPMGILMYYVDLCKLSMGLAPPSSSSG